MKTFHQYLEHTGRYDELFNWLTGKKPQPVEKKPEETPYQRYLRMAGKVPGVLPDADKPKDNKEAEYFKRWERGA